MTRAATGGATPASGDDRGLTEAELARLERSVRSRLGGPVRVADMAASVGRSASCFARLFRSATGETPHAYVTRVRLERARELILDGARAGARTSLSEIAARCGFADQSHLTRVFKEATGETPAAFCRRSGVRPADD